MFKISKEKILQKTIAILLLTILVISNTGIVEARRSKKENYIRKTDNAYTVEKMKVEAKVNENNVIEVKETLDINFNTERHGIFRTLNKNAAMNIDGEVKNVQVKFTDFNVEGAPFTQKNFDNGYIQVKIGDPNKKIIGDKRYVFTYKMGLQNIEPKSKKEILYLNVLGTEINTTVKKFEFEIEMPKKIDWDNVWVYAGELFSTNRGDIVLNKDGSRKMQGYSTAELKPFNAVTIRMDLDEKYFKEAEREEVIPYIYAASGAILIGFILIIHMFIRNGKDEKIAKTITFKLPEELNVFRAEYVLNQNVSLKSIPASIIDLAAKGYIKIVEQEKQQKGIIEKLISEKDNIELVKLKEYTKQDNYRRIMDVIFDISDRITLKELKKKGDIFAIKLQEINEDLGKSALDEKVYDKSGYKVGINMAILSSIPLAILAVLMKVLMNYQPEFIKTSNIVLISIAILTFVVIFGLMYTKKRGLIRVASTLLIIAGIGGAVATGVTSNHFYPVGEFWMVYTGVGVLSVITSLLIIKLEKKTMEGQMLESQILGFKEYIKTAEVEELELMVKSTPNMFYDILPYAYIFGLSSVWIEKFQTVGIPESENFTNQFGSYMLASSIVDSLNSINSEVANGITSAMASSGSGGGFSGGGAGGGGMGSW